MLDPQLLRTDPDSIAARLADRGYDFDAEAWRDMDARRKDLQGVRPLEVEVLPRELALRLLCGDRQLQGEELRAANEVCEALGDLTLAVSTGGASPAAARRLRQRLEREYGPSWGPYLRLLRSNLHLFTRTLALLFAFAYFTAAGESLGIRRWLAMVQAEFPSLKFGYFNPQVVE